MAVMKIYQEKLVGVFGDPVDENPTIVIMQSGFDHLKLPLRYVSVTVKDGDLEAAMKGMRAMNFTGIGITMPHKQKVLQYLDEVEENAAIMGAVNFVYWRDGKLRGENTDGQGFMLSMKKGGVETKGKKAVVLGAGGVARAITVELANAGVTHITVVNIVEDQGKDLVKTLSEKTPADAEFVLWDHTYQVPADTDILVNGTSIGFADGNDCPNIDFATVKPNMIVCDVIPNKETTRFLDNARAIGCRTFNGLGMLVNQSLRCFEVWTGEAAPVEIMEKALKAEFGIL